MYSENLEDFAGLPVVDFEDESSWRGADKSYRLREEYDDERKITDRLNDLLAIPESSQLRSLVIGAWSGACEGDDAKAIVAELANVSERLPQLRALFLGEMTYEECEISWINQADIGPILQAYPQLEELRVRGGTGLATSSRNHQFLRTLAIETGGLPSSFLRDLFECDFPALEHLELLLGEENYGFDGSVEDLQPLLAGELFPNLKYLGLMNADIANDIAAVIVNSPIVERIDVLDLSMGNLDDEGSRSLLGLASFKNLKQLNLSHHYVSEPVVAELQSTLSCEVIAEDRQSPDDEWRPILHAE